MGSFTESAIKTKFVGAVLTETAVKIRTAQAMVVEQWNLFDEGELVQYTKGHFSINPSTLGGKLTMSYVKKMRFLDMKDPRRKLSQPKKEGYHLYNRLNFGTIYNYTYPTIMHGFVEEVRNEFISRLSDALDIPKDQLEGVLQRKARQKTMGIS